MKTKTEQKNGTSEAQVSAEQARAVLLEEEQASKEAFVNGYNELVQRYGWQIIGKPIIKPDGTLGVGFEVQKVTA